MAVDVTAPVSAADTSSSGSTANGYVSTNRPAPAAFGDPLWVILPNFSLDVPFECKWGAIHGATLPAPRADVSVIFDAQGRPNVFWWEGEYS